jgi:glucose/arabinose dehydrogenase
MLLAALVGCGGSDGSATDGGTGPGDGDLPLPASVERVFTGLSFPGLTDLQSQPDADGGDRLFVVRKDGRIDAFDPSAAAPSPTPYLDLRGAPGFADFDTRGEHGLLGLAFHPDYATNGHFYVHLVRSEPRRVEIVRFHDDGSPPVDPDTATPILVADDFEEQPDRTNHVAGGLAFGPADGLLYLTMGDGGGRFDPDGAAQDRADLRGSILRIDVNAAGGAGGYGIPGDNPLAGNASGYREEVFAWGLRNPFRIHIERTGPASQRVWVADVGQNAREEVNVVTAGANYGWDCREGTRTVGDANDSAACETLGDADFTAPVAEYDHSLGRSITGGLVYRGQRLTGALSGRYVYGDFVTGRIWALDAETGQSDILVDTEARIVTFGASASGELYFGDFDTGALYRLAP